jgi:hypothetical protein
VRRRHVRELRPGNSEPRRIGYGRGWDALMGDVMAQVTLIVSGRDETDRSIDYDRRPNGFHARTEPGGSHETACVDSALHC